MPRYELTVEYDGTPYAGWQRQENGHTVQAAIEQAIFKFCGDTISLGAAGRTDSGVHATAQVAHVEPDQELEQFESARGPECAYW